MLRLSGVWTSMSLVLCLLSAYDIHNARTVSSKRIWIVNK